jgi:hypothetical protein
MWTPAQRSARLLAPARVADRPARGVPGSEFVPPSVSTSDSCSTSTVSIESFSKLSGSSGLGRGLLGPTSPSGSVEEREGQVVNSLSSKDTSGSLWSMFSAFLSPRSRIPRSPDHYHKPSISPISQRSPHYVYLETILVTLWIPSLATTTIHTHPPPTWSLHRQTVMNTPIV